MSELIGYIEATKIEPKLEDITITPSKQEQNFKSKVDGYDKIRVNAIPCETLNVTPKKEKQVIEGMYDKVNVDGISAEILNIKPKKESQYFDGIYEKIYVDEIERDNLTVTPSMTEQSFNGLYENVVVEKITGDTLDVTPKAEQQSFNGLYETVNVGAIEIETEEVAIDPDFSTQDTFEVTATEGKYITKATVNKDTDLVPENILEGVNIYGVDGTHKPLDTSDATATAEDVLEGKTFYANGEKHIGTLTSTGGSHNAIVSMEGLTGTAFTVAKTLKTIDFTNVNTSSMKSFSAAFQNLSGLEEIVGLNTIQATNMQNMFSGCSSLNTIPELTTDKVTSMSSMFSGCSSLTTIPLLNTSSVSNVSSMFQNCTSLTTVPLLNLTGVNSMSGMFNGCTNLKSVPAFTPSGVNLRMNIMFYNCTNLTDVPVISTNNTADMQNMFLNCTSLSNDSLNNIMTMCINATRNISSTYRTLKYIGLTSDQATTCTGLSNYQAFLDVGWATGY